MRQAFQPEFLNRIGERVIFHFLGREHLRRIVEIQVGQLLKRLEERKITLVLSDGAKDFLAAVGYDPTCGARPLKRAVQRLVFDPLSRGILGGQFRGGDTMLADWAKGTEALTFIRNGAASAPRGKGKGAGKKRIGPGPGPRSWTRRSWTSEASAAGPRTSSPVNGARARDDSCLATTPSRRASDSGAFRRGSGGSLPSGG